MRLVIGHGQDNYFFCIVNAGGFADYFKQTLKYRVSALGHAFHLSTADRRLRW